MTSRLLAIALLTACGDRAGPPPTEAVFGLEVSTRVRVLDRGDKELVVQVAGPSGTRWTLSPPAADGLRLGEPAERVERVGDRAITTLTYPLRARKGSYILEGVCADPEGDDPPACAPPLYLDVDTEFDRSAMADIAEPEALWPLPSWEWLAGGIAATALFSLGALLAMRREEEVEQVEVDEELPERAALRRWEAIRHDPALSDHDKAVALSEIFRTYAEAVLGFPARAWTTTETLSHLKTLPALPRENLPRARKLLTATDRVKYAEANPNADFFEELDADLRAFVDSTRPVRLEER